MTIAQPWPLKFQIGARTLFSIRRRLVRVPLELSDVLSGQAPVLPPLPAGADGWSVTSLPEPLLDAVRSDSGFAFVRQRYTRYHTDLTIGFDAWFAGLSGNARSGLKRKAKKLAEANDGSLDVRTYRTAQEMAEFHGLARRVAARTYQEKLLGAGLPDTMAFRAAMQGKGAAREAFGWLLFVGGTPIAYLYCPMTAGDVRYDYVGHDPAWSEWSPGSVLHLEAFRTLFAESAALRFDFTEGEGQHKRQFSTGETPCADLLLLRGTLGNRATVTALKAFDDGVARVKRARDWPVVGPLVARVRRG
ncbi:MULTISPECIES: GNAT family N-acetyltransferase [unclassified Sphingomonas]|uniref:GNAT family N-acetyltransferase n=1 Tax=unclassified Sphingomonas TaxID=196159 RepID=UPI0009EB32CD|nr:MULTISPECIES: GNAT family N-acetyltransferase [unclassified Sphingomonas]